MTWLIHIYLCSLATGNCERAPIQPEPYHYFAQERCEREASSFKYSGHPPEGYEFVIVCYDERWP